MDQKYFENKEDTIEYDVRKRAIKGYCLGKQGFLEQMDRLRGI